MDDVPLGNIVDAREDKKGLWFKAELPRTTRSLLDAYGLRAALTIKTQHAATFVQPEPLNRLRTD